jgi:hypothetical protein
MRRIVKMPPQIVRLVLLTIGIVTVYCTARFFLTPPTFAQYGWFRGDALAEIAAREPVHAGKKACEECHSEEYQKVAKYEHKTVACEACHGVGKAHADNPDTPIAKLAFSRCVRCHEADPSRPKWLKQISSRNHYSGQLCTECHIPHQPNEVP